jgi:hypothetical protein
MRPCISIDKTAFRTRRSGDRSGGGVFLHRKHLILPSLISIDVMEAVVSPFNSPAFLTVRFAGPFYCPRPRRLRTNRASPRPITPPDRIIARPADAVPIAKPLYNQQTRG